jgi:hypothetical protein
VRVVSWGGLQRGDEGAYGHEVVVFHEGFLVACEEAQE